MLLTLVEAQKIRYCCRVTRIWREKKPKNVKYETEECLNANQFSEMKLKPAAGRQFYTEILQINHCSLIQRKEEEEESEERRKKTEVSQE